MYRFTIKRTQLTGICAYRTLLIANECSFSYLLYFYLLGCIVERERKRNKYKTIYLSHMLLFCVSLHIFIVIKYHFANSSNWILTIFLEWNENRSLTSLQIWKWLVHFSHWIYKWYENKKFTHIDQSNIKQPMGSSLPFQILFESFIISMGYDSLSYSPEMMLIIFNIFDKAIIWKKIYLHGMSTIFAYLNISVCWLNQNSPINNDKKNC